MSTAVAEPAVTADTRPTPPSAREIARRQAAALARLRAPVMGRTRLAIALAAAGALAALVPFVALARLGELLLAPGPVDRDAVLMVAWLVVAGLGVRGLCLGTALAVTHFADSSLQADLRRRMIDRLGRVPLGWFSDTSSGVVRKSAQDDVSDLHHLVAHHSVELTGAVVLPLGGLAYLLWLDWRLALLAVATLPFYAVAYAWMMRGYQERIQEMNAAFARISAAVSEFVSGIAVIKAFGRARRAHEAYRRTAAEFGETYAGWVRPMLRISALSSSALVAPVVATVNAAGGAWFVAEGWVSPVEAMTGLLVALILPSTVTALGFGAQSRRTAAAAAERIADILDTPVLPVAEHPRVPEGHRVEFDGVSFSYDGRVDVLHGVSLTLEPGTVTALVGPSGSGKSTLATLLPRFHDVTAGAVRLGGVDVREIAPTELYRHVGFVLQDVQLLRASVADNIRLGRPEATDEEVRDAARAAQVHDRITALPRGYDAVIGEDAQLSGGEAQRVSIARALLADTPVLVLDEATAFADPESEAAIQDALSELARGRTLLVVAHRLTTITGADRIAVLDAGAVVEAGTHDELLAAGGRYARMWEATR
ncbi:ABC transporter ATP-binding protein [Pseudonocardia sp.]|uniref:ABC transporter ATP-binding protein n=1 Tax=Pseudonocardia sp. TaxID=60912 RepID=UPI003D117462